MLRPTSARAVAPRSLGVGSSLAWAAAPAPTLVLALTLAAVTASAPAHASRPGRAEARAQTCPSPGTPLAPGLEGENLVTQLRLAYRPTTWLSYDAARDLMYTELDNVGGMVTGRYTGYQAFIDPSSADPRQDAAAAEINAEHSWPQSRGAGVSPMRSDLHHLFPTYSGANSARGSEPFDEIPDELTDTWYRLTTTTSTPVPSLIDEYSERDLQNPHPLYAQRWEPREDHKGDVARAIFYFYTVYRAEAVAGDPSFFDAQKDALRAWHQADPVTAAEYDRTCAIAAVQDGKPNPFVIDSTLVERAYFSGGGSTLVQFAAADDAVRESDGTYDLVVTILGADPTNATQVQVALVGGTATNGQDIATFAAQTVVFGAGVTTPQVVTIDVLEDQEDEPDETLVFRLGNPQGGSAAALGTPFELTLTLRDDTVGLPTASWINEFHYDNAGSDSGEFVEIVVTQPGDAVGLTLTAYNGSTGTAYASYEGATDFVPGAIVGGVRFYRVDAPGLQNGSPDGFSLDRDGTLLQFLSYEGAFDAVDGPADGQASVDVGVEEASSAPVGTSIALVGTGSAFDEFTWSGGVSATPGDVNPGQTIDGGTPVLLSDLRVVNVETGLAIEWWTSALGTDTGEAGFFVERWDGGGWRRISPWIAARSTAPAGATTTGESRHWHRHVDGDVRPGVAVRYRVEAMRPGHPGEHFGPVTGRVPRPDTARLTARPNPSSSTFRLRYELRRSGRVDVTIYDLAGRRVRTLEDGTRPAGSHHVAWDGRDRAGRALAAGTYFARLRTAQQRRSIRLTLVR